MTIALVILIVFAGLSLYAGILATLAAQRAAQTACDSLEAIQAMTQVLARDDGERPRKHL